MQYRKRQGIVQAVQFKSLGDIKEICLMVKTGLYVSFEDGVPVLDIYFEESHAMLGLGKYIVQTGEGDFDVMSEDCFNEMYEPEVFIDPFPRVLAKDIYKGFNFKVHDDVVDALSRALKI